MIEPSEKTKFILFNWNPSGSQNGNEFLELIEDVIKYVNEEKLLPEDFSVYELGKEIKFKLVPT